MNKKAKRGFAVSLAVTFGFVLILTLVFLRVGAKGETDPLGDANTNNSSSSAVSDDKTSSESSSSNTSTNTLESGQSGTAKVTLNFNGGTGGDTMLDIPSGTQVGDLATPVKKGYKFTGWTSGGNNIMSSFKIYDNISLTAQWEKIQTESKKSTTSGKSPTTTSAPVDTHQSDVDAAASKAEAAVSDPDALSSEDWSDVFSSSGGTSSNTKAAGLLSSENGGSSSGGSSWLFIVGIVLIVLAAGGIALFIYLQFFHTPHSGRRNKGISEDMDDTADIDSFTDINSDSSGTQQRTDRDDSNDSTEPIIASDSSVKSEMLKKSKPQSHAADIPSAASDVSPTKAQAKPVNGAKSDFDWDKFFNDDDDDI